MILIDADALRQRMYHEAFEADTDMQRWDSGCWIRYKLFENCLDSMPAISNAVLRPVGKWVKNHDEVMWWWECSNCKEKPLISRFGDAEVLSAYCPRCGAKLEIPEGE